MKAMDHLEMEQAKLQQRLQEIEDAMQQHTDQRHLLLGQKVALAMAQSEEFAQLTRAALASVVKKKREWELLDMGAQEEAKRPPTPAF